MTVADVRARIQERFGVEAVVDGGVSVTLPRERWQEFSMLRSSSRCARG